MGANPWCHLDAPDLTRLDLASVPVHDWLDTPYLVGSCLDRPDFRDEANEKHPLASRRHPLGLYPFT